MLLFFPVGPTNNSARPLAGPAFRRLAPLAPNGVVNGACVIQKKSRKRCEVEEGPTDPQLQNRVGLTTRRPEERLPPLRCASPIGGHGRGRPLVVELCEVTGAVDDLAADNGQVGGGIRDLGFRTS